MVIVPINQRTKLVTLSMTVGMVEKVTSPSRSALSATQSQFAAITTEGVETSIPITGKKRRRIVNMCRVYTLFRISKFCSYSLFRYNLANTVT